MRPFAPLRSLAVLALLAIAPGLAGPGAIVATLASFSGDGAHHISVQPDTGHDDYVFCHDARDVADPARAVFAPADCSDDHRLHASSAESLVSRHQVAQLQHDAAIGLVALPQPATPAFVRIGVAEFQTATLVASRHHRTVVLRL